MTASWAELHHLEATVKETRSLVVADAVTWAAEFNAQREALKIPLDGEGSKLYNREGVASGMLIQALIIAYMRTRLAAGADPTAPTPLYTQIGLTVVMMGDELLAEARAGLGDEVKG